MAKTPNKGFTYYDDFTGNVLDESEVKEVSLSIEGTTYNLILSSDSYKKLNSALDPFVKDADKAKSRVVTPATPRAPRAKGVARPGAIKWKQATYNEGGRLTAAQNTEWDALPDSEKKKYQ